MKCEEPVEPFMVTTNLIKRLVIKYFSAVKFMSYNVFIPVVSSGDSVVPSGRSMIK